MKKPLHQLTEIEFLDLSLITGVKKTDNGYQLLLGSAGHPFPKYFCQHGLTEVLDLANLRLEYLPGHQAGLGNCL